MAVSFADASSLTTCAKRAASARAASRSARLLAAASSADASCCRSSPLWREGGRRSGVDSGQPCERAGRDGAWQAPQGVMGWTTLDVSERREVMTGTTASPHPAPVAVVCKALGLQLHALLLPRLSVHQKVGFQLAVVLVYRCSGGLQLLSRSMGRRGVRTRWVQTCDGSCAPAPAQHFHEPQLYCKTVPRCSSCTSEVPRSGSRPAANRRDTNQQPFRALVTSQAVVRRQAETMRHGATHRWTRERAPTC